MFAFVALALWLSPAAAGFNRNGEYREPCLDLPPIDKRLEPTVPYRLIELSSRELQERCGGPFSRVVIACSRQEDPFNPNDWIVVIDADMPPADKACVLLYQKAHMPPNNWVDRDWEQFLKGASTVRNGRA
jgi:hypothetical protein